MAWPKNTMDVFKLLNQSNCKDCGAPTCLAFAAAVFKGDQRLGACPHLSPEIVDQYGEPDTTAKGIAADIAAAVSAMKAEIQTIDLSAAAGRLGGRFDNGKLTVKIMGKDFSVDAEGNLYSDIHIHGWLAIPFLDYVLNCQGAALSGKWVPLRELEKGKDWDQFFTHKCEKALKKVADAYPDLFEDMVHLFNGRPVSNHYQSDIALILSPLPNVPILICYWKPEDGMASDLNIFFDAITEKNLPIESVYRLGVGIVVMFEKIALRHGLK